MIAIHLYSSRAGLLMVVRSSRNVSFPVFGVLVFFWFPLRAVELPKPYKESSVLLQSGSLVARNQQGCCDCLQYSLFMYRLAIDTPAFILMSEKEK
jgi:hypothetical protein